MLRRSRKLSSAWAKRLMLPVITATATFARISPITTARESLAAPLLEENMAAHLALALTAGRGNHRKNLHHSPFSHTTSREGAIQTELNVPAMIPISRTTAKF